MGSHFWSESLVRRSNASVFLIVGLVSWLRLCNANLNLFKFWLSNLTRNILFLNLFSFGNIIMYSSYNKFSHNVYRDANIVTTLDTFTSLLAGCCIFGILGNLAYELDVDDVSQVMKSGAGLAFISYPDAIAKFKTFPQIFAVLFFLMLYLLGIGSNVAMMSCIMTVIRDRFKRYVECYACRQALHRNHSVRSCFHDMSL